jgi:hypothetical protein
MTNKSRPDALVRFYWTTAIVCLAPVIACKTSLSRSVRRKAGQSFGLSVGPALMSQAGKKYYIYVWVYVCIALTQVAAQFQALLLGFNPIMSDRA